MKILSTSLALLIAGCLSSVDGARAAASPPEPVARPDRQQIQSMLIQSGFSSVATLRLVQSHWVGMGAHDGSVVDFTVDAATGRLVSEVQAR